MRLIATILAIVLVSLPLSAAGPASQMPTLPDASHATPDAASDPQVRNDRSPLDQDMEHKMEKARREQRYRDLKRDAEKLLELATELKQYVDKSGENVLSLEVLKKADQMEKLARDLKNRMKGD